MAVQTGSIYVVKEQAKNDRIEVFSIGQQVVKLRMPKGKARGAGFSSSSRLFIVIRQNH